MQTEKRFGVGAAGVGAELACVAAAALGAPSAVWVLLLLTGLGLIVYAVVIGEPDMSGEALDSRTVEGGSGDGDLRGNVFGDNATVQVNNSPAIAVDPLVGKHRTLRSPEQLVTVYQGRTDVQARKLLEPHLDSWMKLKGDVSNVTERGINEVLNVWIDLEDAEGVSAVLTFRPDAEQRVLALEVGDPIEIIGRLAAVAKIGYLDLDECSFVD